MKSNSAPIERIEVSGKLIRLDRDGHGIVEFDPPQEGCRFGIFEQPDCVPSPRSSRMYDLWVGARIIAAYNRERIDQLPLDLGDQIPATNNLLRVSVRPEAPKAPRSWRQLAMKFLNF